MVKVFLDTNHFIGLAYQVPEISSENIDRHRVFISILSCHILFYVNKIKVPDTKTNSFINDFNILDLNQKILSKARIGPTPDLEDNIQLHSAAEAECGLFLTSDKKLLMMKFFGNMKIVGPEEMQNE